MVGAVLAQELLLGSRRSRQLIFRRVYTGWLIVQLSFLYFIYLVEANVLGRFVFGGEIETDAASAFANSLVQNLVWQQFLLLLLATPAFTAGAITDEKARGTLQYLLTAGLTSWEILLGKLLGRAAQVALLALAALPILCFIGVFGGLNVILLATLFAVTVAPMFALGSASLLASVWSKQTRDAVLTVYFCVLAGWLLLWAVGGLDLFNPFHVLEPGWGGSEDLKELARRLSVSVLAWGSVGGVCLGLAGWRLRAAYLRQLEGEGRPKKARWWRARRSALGDEPIRWKERQVEGLAPLAGLRRIPRWLGILAILAATLLSSGLILLEHLTISPRDLPRLVQDQGPIVLLTCFNGADHAFLFQGVIAMLVATFLIGVRCSGAVTGERERLTWEALLLTPLPVQHLIRGKLWGILGASSPYLLAYAVPAVTLSVLGGPWAICWTGVWLAVSLLAMAFVGAAGLWCSVRAKSSWRSLLGTVLIGYVGGFFLYGVAWPLALIVFAVIWITLTLIDLLNKNQTSLGPAFSGTFGFYVIASCAMLVLGFIGMTAYFLSDAQKYVASRERIRHWKTEKEEMKAVRTRPRRMHASKPV
jgi:ABC-type transport system involved in multi-copper enzyme maturation permease subunit